MKIKVCKDFSKAPGPRYRTEGSHSGQEFREEILRPKVEEAIRNGNILEIDLDGTFGFGTSFLEEAFGGLIRDDNIPFSALKTTLKLTATEEPELITEIESYMAAAARSLGH